jgi:ParB-like chromosome segregation protein Spo0J
MAAEMKPVGYAFHEVANIFPLMSPEEFTGLVDDIKKNGLREPVWLYEGKIIDGRNRYKACREAGEKPRFSYYSGGPETLVDFVVSQNLHRRHLTASQKAMLGAEIERELARLAKDRQRLAAVKTNGKTGRATQVEIIPQASGATVTANLPEASKAEQSSEPTAGAGTLVQKFAPAIKGKARDQAAQLAGVNRQYVSDAKKIVANAPEVAERVKAGTMDMQDAKALADLPAPQRRAALDVLDNGGAKNGRKAAALALQAMPVNVAQLPLADVPRPAPKPLIDLKGRSPEDFQACTRALGATERFDEFAAKHSPAAVVRGSNEIGRGELKQRLPRLVTWCQQLEKELVSYESK